jgi:hypothetical protein
MSGIDLFTEASSLYVRRSSVAHFGPFKTFILNLPRPHVYTQTHSRPALAICLSISFMILSVGRVGSFDLFFNPLLHPRVSIALHFQFRAAPIAHLFCYLSLSRPSFSGIFQAEDTSEFYRLATGC